MKPIKLVMSAYGSYGGRTEVDFTRYDAEGLFIITGDTGAGKTTIFDAMCYALYGEASGAFRGNKTFRSNFAEEAVETYVDFTFLQGGKEYRIVREPEYYYRRLVKKTGKYKEQKHSGSVELHMPDGEILTKERQVNGSKGAVEDLLGMTFEQFKQVSMIAQGEFQQVLNASSDKRLEIFRKLFDTDKYQNFSNKMREHSSAANAAYTNIKQDIINLIAQLRLDKGIFDAYYNGTSSEEASVASDEFSLPTELDVLQGLSSAAASENIIDETVVAVKRIKAADDAQQEELSNQIKSADDAYAIAVKATSEAKSYNRAIDNYTRRIASVEALEAENGRWKREGERLERGKLALYKVKPVYDAAEKAGQAKADATFSLEAGRAEQKNAEDKYNEAIEIKKLAASHKAELEGLRVEIAELRKKEPDYEKAEKLAQAIKEAEENQERLNKEHDKVRAEVKEMKADISQDEEQLKLQPQVQRDYEAKDFGFTAIKDIYRELNKVSQEDLHNASVDYHACREDYTDKLKKYVAAKQQYEDAYRLLELNRAGILADYLRENPGAPCPVCGSLHHPELAEHRDSNINEVRVNKLKGALDKANAAQSNAYTELKVARDRILGIIRGIIDSYDGFRECVSTKHAAPLADKALLATIPEPVLSLPMGELQDAYKSSILLIKNVTENTVPAEYNEHIEHTEAEYHEATEDLMDYCRGAVDGFLRQKEIVAGYGKRARMEKDAAKAERDRLTGIQNGLTAKRKDYQAAQDKEKSKLEELNLAKLKATGLKGQQSAMEELRFESLAVAISYRKQQEELADSYQRNIDKAEKEEKAANEAATKARARVQELQLQLAKSIDDEEKAAEALAAVLAENSFADKAEYKVALLPEARLKDIERSIRDYEDDLQKGRVQLAEARKQLKLDAKGNVVLEKSDEQQLAADEAGLKERADGLKRLQQEIKARTEHNAEITERLKGKREALISAGSTASHLEELYKYISGQSTGKVKLSLESYVQAAGFDRIIAAANQRLNMISGGQYRLVRHDDTQDMGNKSKAKEDKRSSHALDLDVHDSYTGATRPVGTLSGGESFKASLSLALGLSDTVARDNAGISVDSIFIDEGFGTLDGQSLADTVNMLTSLASRNKLVGIISHNEELARSISQKLEVRKDDAKGSYLLQN